MKTVDFKNVVEWAMTEHKNGHSRPTAPEELLDDLNFPTYFLDIYEDECEVCFEVDLVTWMCTDTMVGWKLVIYDGAPAAFVYKPFRKSDPTVDWISTAKGRNMPKQILDWGIAQLRKKFDKNIEDAAATTVDLNEIVGFTDVTDCAINDVHRNVFELMKESNDT